MAWAAGNFTRANGATEWQDDAALGIGIEPGMHDAQDNDLATGINNCLTKDGQNAPTADLPMGAFKHTNVANATARNHYAAVGQVQDGDYIWLGTTGGTATAMTATATPAITAYKAGQKFRMKIGSGLGSTGNTPTSHTLNINGLGAKDLAVNDGANSSPTLGTWVAGNIIELVYDGNYFQIINDPGGWLTYTPTFTPNGGSITNLSIGRAKYRKIGKTIFIQIYATFNTTGVGVNINVSVPVNFNITTSNFYEISMNYSGSLVAGYITNNSATVFGCYKDLAAGSWGTAVSSAVYINTHYEAV